MLCPLHNHAGTLWHTESVRVYMETCPNGQRNGQGIYLSIGRDIIRLNGDPNVPHAASPSVCGVDFSYTFSRPPITISHCNTFRDRRLLAPIDSIFPGCDVRAPLAAAGHIKLCTRATYPTRNEFLRSLSQNSRFFGSHSH